MRARDTEEFGPAPSWIWDPARQKAVWENAPAAALFATFRARPLDGTPPVADPMAALSNACHATLIAAGFAEFGPVRILGREIRCRSALKRLEGGGVGVLIEVTDSGPTPEGADSAEAHLARAAHDLRTPLTAIIGFAEFIAASGAAMPEATRRDYLSDIADAGRFAARMAEDLLTFTTVAQPESAATAAGARADLIRIAQATARLLAMEAERRDVRLTVVLDLAEALVAAEPDQIRRAVGNLASNALTHASRAVEIAVKANAAGGVAIRVSDDGPGLTSDELQLALQPFGRPKAATGAKGVGLGLPIARRFAEANGAQLEIDTAPGAGFSASIRFLASRRISA